MAALPTQVVGCNNAVLALGRQLKAYVLAADLSSLRTSSSGPALADLAVGGSGRRTSVATRSGTRSRYTHENSPNNWGAYAGAARIAADLYLGDTTDLAAAAKVTQGFLGDRTAYAGFNKNLSSAALSWSCSGRRDLYAGELGLLQERHQRQRRRRLGHQPGRLAPKWPPADAGIPYQLDSIQGLGLQVELLYRAGYTTAWSWSSSALKRMAGIVTRSAASGGAGWNGTLTARQMPWLLNKRYGLGLPTKASGMGRAIGFTDWIWDP